MAVHKTQHVLSIVESRIPKRRAITRRSRFWFMPGIGKEGRGFRNQNSPDGVLYRTELPTANAGPGIAASYGVVIRSQIHSIERVARIIKDGLIVVTPRHIAELPIIKTNVRRAGKNPVLW